MPKFEVKWWERVYHSTIVEAKDADEANMIFSDSDDDEITDYEFGDVLEIGECPND